ncbi:MAG: prepilin-type N-terminal cleavage/methylation domain-containing protein [Xanthomonadales bacterium]|nr:prepilin-type N-terminal cleavage/methylation domain-containing protein [Xanthomonadales bacterium]
MSARGFTLVELVAALTLFALLAAIAFGTMGGAVRAAAGGERLAAASERVRVTQQFLRRQIGFALPLPFAADAATGSPIVFRGDREAMEFVAQMPGHLGEGGPRRQRLALERVGRGLALTFRFMPLTPLDPSKEIEDEEPVVLLAGLRGGRFRYRGLDDGLEPGEWSEEWQDHARPPLWVAVELELAEEEPVSWPELVVALQVDGVVGGLFLFGPSPGGVDFGPRPGGGGAP